MYKDLRILILDAQILPSIPDWIREQMFELTHDFKVGSGGKQVKAFVEQLKRYKGICYIRYKGHEIDRINNLQYCQVEDITENVKTSRNANEKVRRNTPPEMSTATFQLRKRRKEIYEKMKVNPTVNAGLTKDFIGYQNQVGEFINGFKKHLTNKEISIWRNKVRQTESDVRHFQEENEILKLKTSASQLREVSSEAKTFVKDKIPQGNDDLIQFEDLEDTEARCVVKVPMSESSFDNKPLIDVEENRALLAGN